MTSGYVHILAEFAAQVRVGDDPDELTRAALRYASISLDPSRSLAVRLEPGRGLRLYLEQLGWDDHDPAPLLDALEQHCQERDLIGTDGVMVLSEAAGEEQPLFLSQLLTEQGVGGLATLIVHDVSSRRLYILVLLRDHPGHFQAADMDLLQAMANLLAMAIEQRRCAEQRELGLEQVIQIKHEWEATVDTLPQLICALDQNARVTRANRTLENWALGTVQAVRGLGIHELLHRRCLGRDCQLQQRFEQAWSQLAEGESSVWELEDPQLQRDLRIHLERAVKLTYRGVANDSHAVMVVEDIGHQRQLERTREQFNQQLQDRLEERTGQLTAANQELRRLSAQRLSWQEAERKRIALELHDGLGQTMSEIKFRTESVLQDLRTHPDEASTADHLLKIAHVVERLRQGIDEVRRIAMDLRPSTLDDLGLLPTISWFCREYRQTYQKSLQLDTDIDISEALIPAPLKIVVFRILQEALNNIAKHARADQVHIHLGGDEQQLHLRIRDDGAGFQVPTGGDRAHGFGLSNMRQRAELSGGSLTIRSGAGQGTVVEARWTLGDVLAVAD